MNDDDVCSVCGLLMLDHTVYSGYEGALYLYSPKNIDKCKTYRTEATLRQIMEMIKT